jgi:hypothetical protein
VSALSLPFCTHFNYPFPYHLQQLLKVVGTDSEWRHDYDRIPQGPKKHPLGAKAIQNYFSILHRYNPDYSRDPFVAGSFVRSQLINEASQQGQVDLSTVSSIISEIFASDDPCEIIMIFTSLSARRRRSTSPPPAGRSSVRRDITDVTALLKTFIL